MKEHNLINITLSEEEISILLNILDFSRMAGALLAHQEIIKGTGVKGAKHMDQISKDSKSLYNYFLKHLAIGEPTEEILN